MEKIHLEIHDAINNCYMTTGKKATRIYLGRQQMDRLLQWAHANNYIADTGEYEGDNRPEVAGCFVYEVNAVDHCAAI